MTDEATSMEIPRSLSFPKAPSPDNPLVDPHPPSLVIAQAQFFETLMKQGDILHLYV